MWVVLGFGIKVKGPGVQGCRTWDLGCEAESHPRRFRVKPVNMATMIVMMMMMCYDCKREFAFLSWLLYLT